MPIQITGEDFNKCYEQVNIKHQADGQFSVKSRKMRSGKGGGNYKFLGVILQGTTQTEAYKGGLGVSPRKFLENIHKNYKFLHIFINNRTHTVDFTLGQFRAIILPD